MSGSGSSVQVGPPDDPASNWEVHRCHGTAAELHGLDLVEVTGVARSLWRMEVTGPAVVLGSVQAGGINWVSDDARDTEPSQHGDVGARLPEVPEVAVRRSGGGAVRLEPKNGLWLDVVIPRSDPLWVDDVSHSALWLGQAWKQALETLGVDSRVHDGPADRHHHARAACFAGVGPGEVISGNRKLVGIAQRRTRQGARLQCVAYSQPPEIADLVAVVGGDEALGEHLRATTGVVEAAPDVLFAAVRHAIMTACMADVDGRKPDRGGQHRTNQ